jgi:hypothetical protein
LAFDDKKLTADLINANQLAFEAAGKVRDGGSANLDSVFLRVPRVREIKVLEAIKASVLYCRAKRRWIGEGYMITPTSIGQGDKRAIAVQTMAKHLKEEGWDVLTYEQMD